MNRPCHLSLRIHDSLVGNVGETLIGSETLTDEGLVENCCRTPEMEVPDGASRSDPTATPQWSIFAFPRSNP